MKIRFPLFILPIIASSCALIPQSVTDESGSPVRECPYRHATLRKIPILYGMRKPSPELIRSIDNGEVILGHGGWHSEDGWHFPKPKKALLCTTCKFVFHPPSGMDGDKGYWSRRSTDITSFKERFPPHLAQFPLPKQGQLIEPPMYIQDVRQGETMASSVEFTVRKPLATLKEEIVQFLGDNQLNAQYDDRLVPAEKKGGGFLEWMLNSVFRNSSFPKRRRHLFIQNHRKSRTNERTTAGRLELTLAGSFSLMPDVFGESK